MYKVLIDNEILSWSNTEETALLSAVLTLEANKAGTFVFSMAPNHPKYNACVFRQSLIDVYQDADLIFEGVPVSEETDFDNVKTVTCEGELTFLNDTIQRPAKYTGQTVTGLLTAYLSAHNADCDASKTFTLGTVTVNGGSALYRYTNYESTMTELAEDLIDNLGGYFRVRHSGGVRYLDYLASSPHTSTQIIKIGYNLLDLSKNYSSTDICTMLIPLGATIDGQEAVQGIDKHVDITSVNGGLDYLTSTAAATYGKIWRTVVWDGINDASTLKTTATAYLSDAQWANMVLEARAFDLGLARSDVEQFRLLDEIRVVSAPHGLDRNFMLTKMELNLNAPEQTMITLGEETFLPISAASAKTTAEVENQNTQMQVIATQHARDLLENATGGCVYFRYDQNGVLYEIDIMNTNDPNTATKMWRWNINGWGYSDDGGQTYTIAATMDGEIDANFIKTGTLDANRIAAGSITLGKLETNVQNQLSGIVTENLVPAVYASEAANGSPWTTNGLTFTVNADRSVTVTGTNSSASTVYYYIMGSSLSSTTGIYPVQTDPTKRYTVSGCPSGGSTSSYWLRIYYGHDGTTFSNSRNETGTGGETLPLNYEYMYIRLCIAGNYALPVGGVTFYPMLETGTVAHAFQRSQTVVDAGNILTGYINANRIDANSITLSKLASDVTTPITNAQNTADAAAFREQIIYKSVASGGSATATTTWVTTATDTQNTWTTVRPTYNSSYPVLYVALQKQTMAQSSGTTCSCTTPAIDNTTTVIDGGHITTGSIDANLITTGTLSASVIGASTITLAKLASDVTTPLNSIPIENLLPDVYHSQVLHGDVWETNGLKFTVNADGSVTVTGTASANTSFYLMSSDFTGGTSGVRPIKIDSAKKYKVTGCPSGGSSSTYFIGVYRSSNGSSWASVVRDTGSGYTVGTGYEYLYLRITIQSSYACPQDGLTFYPMITTGEETYSYQKNATIIDGGHIVTGTLDATKVNVTNLNADNITTGALTVLDSSSNTIFSADKSNKAVSIAGWSVTNNKISSNSGNTYISSDTSDYAFKATNTVIAHNGDIHSTGHLQLNGSGYIDLNSTTASIKTFNTSIIEAASTAYVRMGYQSKNVIQFFNNTTSDGVYMTINGTTKRLYFSGTYVRIADPA